MVHEFGWELDDWNRLGRGTAVGHLLECAGQLTGGYFADPGYKDVPDLDRLGFPIAEVTETGEALLMKLDGSGGALTVRNCKEQILYEVQDPSRYLTPDVTADFSTVRFNELGPDRVQVSGARGAERPMTLKVSTGFDAGFLTEGQSLLRRAWSPPPCSPSAADPGETSALDRSRGPAHGFHRHRFHAWGSTFRAQLRAL